MLNLTMQAEGDDSPAGPSPDVAAPFWTVFAIRVIRTDPIEVIANKTNIDPNITANFGMSIHDSHFLCCSELSQTLDNDSPRRNMDETVECKSFVVHLLSLLDIHCLRRRI
jgi:hypothetical protein